MRLFSHIGNRQTSHIGAGNSATCTSTVLEFVSLKVVMAHSPARKTPKDITRSDRKTGSIGTRRECTRLVSEGADNARRLGSANTRACASLVGGGGTPARPCRSSLGESAHPCRYRG